MIWNITWADFYLTCFAVGFLLSAISFISGGLRWHLHLPHFPQAAGHAGAGNAPVAHGHGATSAHGHAPHQPHVSPFNFVSMTAFLAWFGGTGFLIARFSSIWYALGLLISLAAGIFGGGIVFLFMTRVLISHEENMNAADYEMAGVLGRVSMTIRENGTGEIIYSQAGTRRTCGARTDSGGALEKGTEVVVDRYEEGIAYVNRWEDLSGE